MVTCCTTSDMIAPHSTLLLQLLGVKGHPSVFSSLSTNAPYWKLVRKGVAPAFAPQNLRQALFRVWPTHASAASTATYRSSRNRLWHTLAIATAVGSWPSWDAVAAPRAPDPALHAEKAVVCSPVLALLCRKGFPHVLRAAQEVCQVLSSLPEGQPADLDELLQRESLDVIGTVGFQKHFGAVQVSFAAGYVCWCTALDCICSLTQPSCHAIMPSWWLLPLIHACISKVANHCGRAPKALVSSLYERH